MADRTQEAMVGIDCNLRVDVEFGGSRAVRTTPNELSKAGLARPAIQRWTLDE